VGGGRLVISATRAGDTPVRRVRDTGRGLADTPGPGPHFGLVQVRERLATLYGARARLSLAPCTDPDGGTIATIRLPLPASTS